MSHLDTVELTGVLGHRKALREFGSVPPARRRDIVDKCEEAARMNHPLEHPAVGKIAGEGLYRVRSGNYRAIVDYHTGRVRILRVAHRDQVYEEGSVSKAKHRHTQR